MRFPGFIGPSYTLQSVNADCQRTVNLYPEMNEVGTEKEQEVACLVGTPGLKLLASVGTGPIRGIWTASNGNLYVVSGDEVYGLDANWQPRPIGTLLTDQGPVSMADNGIQLFIVDGPNGYYITLAGEAFTHVTDVNFLGADQVTFQDGYFIFNKPGTEQFYISGLNAITFDPTDIGTAEGFPDNIVGLISDQKALFLFGTQSTEVFYDSGDTFPFVRIQGAFIPIGCMATFSIALLQGTIFWLGQDAHGCGIVYSAQGYQAQRISTHAVERVLASFGANNLKRARAWVYQQSGHYFYCLNLPGADTTWVYDTTTSQWHERTYLSLGQPGRHRAECHAFAFGSNVVGDFNNGNVYALDPTVYSDNSAPIQRIRTAPHISKDLSLTTHYRFQLDMETGVGLDGVGQGTAPSAILQWSDDGGHSWSNEKTAAIGPIGGTKTRVIWRRLGISRDRVYRVKITDPIKVTLLGADITLQEETA